MTTGAVSQNVSKLFSSAGVPVFLQSCLQSPFGLPDEDLAAAAGDTIYHIGPRQRTGAVAEVGPAHPDDNLREPLQRGG